MLLQAAVPLGTFLSICNKVSKDLHDAFADRRISFSGTNDSNLVSERNFNADKNFIWLDTIPLIDEEVFDIHLTRSTLIQQHQDQLNYCE